MNAVIVSIGDELMNGFTIDTNSSWIANKLQMYKTLRIVSKITILDNISDIKSNVDILIKKKINELTESNLLEICSIKASKITDGQGAGRVIKEIYE